ncbi:extracellular solute-binding protein [Paenibacillus sp. J2TS4]|uniref:extracellular solute-binding protein n=1 Tax=Paenibacillus sp. J2TS4 TaxID=2807194 RepID=UPI001B01863A|nr:extracellular solute-binding protein [Paenibacillus sp. J2TS4]GIP34163.1 ABC transporter substrate-binding protein [Paenibacillus sp. J2TS4]
MESKRIWAFVSLFLLIFVGAGFYWFRHANSSPLVKREITHPVTIEAWVYTKALASSFAEFDRENDEVEVETRVFRSYEQLYDELTAAISAHHVPQVVELSSFYGIAQLAETGDLLPLDEHLPARLWDSLHPDLTAYFQYRSSSWAMPYGASIPVLFYNQDLLRYSGVNDGSDGAQLNGWNELIQAARQVAASEYWGLVVDDEAPWYFQNWLLSNGEDKVTPGKAAKVLALWQRLVEEERMMPPLQQQLAASDFIDGRAGLFLSSSDKRAMLEKYIGGKFSFGMMAIPDASRFIPKVNGLAVLRSSEDKEEKALAALAYMNQTMTQERIAEATSQFPARREDDGSPTRVTGFDALEGARNPLLSLENRFNPVTPSIKDKERWKEMETLIEEIELSREVSADDLIKSMEGERTN